ncbi:MAG: hydrogenase formation protein HypD, partial [Treponema sp.]|nr:hydrogenase formation protein HypD [Treponema sp.]
AALLDALIAEGIRNVSFYTALKTMPEVLEYVCVNEAIDAFLCPGHVSAVIGSAAYEPLCAKFKKPFVIAGFEAEHILAAVYEIINQTENRRPAVRNLYPSVVSRDGQTKALELIDKYFEKTDSYWRGIGGIKNSGLKIRGAYSEYWANGIFSGLSADRTALSNFTAGQNTAGQNYAAESPPPGCRCTDVMLGRINPDECTLFGGECTPNHPVGACMVSAEGACGIWENSEFGIRNSE